MRILPYLLLTAFFIAFSIQAQTEKERQEKYLRAKSLIKEKKYQLAADLLKPLTLVTPDNTFAAPSLYLYALTQYYEKNYDASRYAARKLNTVYPEWNQDEVLYLLALNDFAQNNYERALKTTQNLQNWRIENNTRRMKLYFLQQINEVNTLKKLQKEFPQDKEVAETLIYRLGKSTDKEDNKLARQLAKQFNINSGAPNNIENENTLKNQYKIALLFPFLLEETATTDYSPKNNQFLLDFYAGCQIALDTLQKSGINNIELLVYDSKRSAEKINYIVHQPDFSDIDVVVGPVYADEWKNTHSTLKQLKQVIFNPFSDNEQITENTNNILLAQSSLQTQVKQAIALAEKNFITQKVLILYQNNTKDSTIAHLYKKHFTSKKDTVQLHAIKKDGNESIQKFLAKNYKDSLCHVVVVSQNPAHIQTLMTFLDIKNQQVPIISFYPQILNAPNMLLERIKRHQVHLIYPDYIDTEKEIYQVFKKKYLKKYNILPSLYACKGYDLIYFIAQNLHQKGTKFYLDARLDATQSILSGYLYKNTKSNQQVPFIYINEWNDIAIKLN